MLSNEKTLTVNNFFLRAIKEDIFKVSLISLTLCRKRLKYRFVSFLRIATKFQQAVRSIDHIRPYIIRPWKYLHTGIKKALALVFIASVPLYWYVMRHEWPSFDMPAKIIIWMYYPVALMSAFLYPTTNVFLHIYSHHITSHSFIHITSHSFLHIHTHLRHRHNDGLKVRS